MPRAFLGGSTRQESLQGSDFVQPARLMHPGQHDGCISAGRAGLAFGSVSPPEAQKRWLSHRERGQHGRGPCGAGHRRDWWLRASTAGHATAGLTQAGTAAAKLTNAEALAALRLAMREPGTALHGDSLGYLAACFLTITHQQLHGVHRCLCSLSVCQGGCQETHHHVLQPCG